MILFLILNLSWPAEIHETLLRCNNIECINRFNQDDFTKKNRFKLCEYELQNDKVPAHCFGSPKLNSTNEQMAVDRLCVHRLKKITQLEVLLRLMPELKGSKTCYQVALEYKNKLTYMSLMNSTAHSR